jgi:hypothetical protein
MTIQNRATVLQPASDAAQESSPDRPIRNTSAHLCGAPESFNAHGNATIHTTDKRFQQEAGKSRSRGCTALHALQLLPRTQKSESYACDGSGLTDHIWEIEELIALIAK